MRFKNATEVTVTDTWQVPPAASCAPVKETWPLPGAAATVPPAQVVCALGVEYT